MSELDIARARLLEEVMTGKVRNFNAPVVGRPAPNPSTHMDKRMHLTLEDVRAVSGPRPSDIPAPLKFSKQSQQ